MLIEELKKFSTEVVKIVKTEGDLTTMFERLAKDFLYGGYISVKDYSGKEFYQIHIKTIEFYFHCEEGSKLKIEDPIVYHRNGNYDFEVPYFPLMSLNTHQSGIDITFENEEAKYRASALIRAFTVNEDKKIEKRSTYIYDYVNGFSLDNSNSITWIDSKESLGDKHVNSACRKNVAEYIKNKDGIYEKRKYPDMSIKPEDCNNDAHPKLLTLNGIKYYQDLRKWQFS